MPIRDTKSWPSKFAVTDAESVAGRPVRKGLAVWLAPCDTVARSAAATIVCKLRFLSTKRAYAVA